MKALILPAAAKTIIRCPDGDTEGARLPDPSGAVAGVGGRYASRFSAG